MPDHAAVYLTRALTLDDIRAIGNPGAVAGVGETIAMLSIGKVRVTVNSMPAGKLVEHLAGLRGYVQARLVVRDPGFLVQISQVVQTLGIVAEPGMDSAGAVRAFVAALARRGHGFVFRNPDLHDADGRVLAGPAGYAGEPSATGGRGEAEDSDEGEDDEEEDELVPPEPSRVLRRAWALAATSWRALAETHEDAAEAERGVGRIRAWVAEVGLDDELEANERVAIDLQLGALEGQALVNASWRAEGLAVLAWGLGVRAARAPSTEGAQADGSLSG